MNAGGLEVEIAGTSRLLSRVADRLQATARILGLPGAIAGIPGHGAGPRGASAWSSSRKAAPATNRKRAACGSCWPALRDGAEVDGTVARLESFGARSWMLGGVDWGSSTCLRFRHERTQNPSDVLAVGQTVRVKVLGVKEKDGRPKISLYHQGRRRGPLGRGGRARSGRSPGSGSSCPGRFRRVRPTCRPHRRLWCRERSSAAPGVTH